MFFDQLKILCEKEGTSPSTLIEAMGMSKGSIGNWSKGKLPKGEYLAQFSEHFNVSLDYLVYGSECNAFSSDLSTEEQHLLSLFRNLPDGAKENFIKEMEIVSKYAGLDTEPIRQAK